MLRKAGRFVIGLLITLVILEIGSFAALAFLGERTKSFDEIFYASDNMFLRGECNYEATLYPHPYLAFVHNADCLKLNNIGLLGEDVQMTKRANLVRIGIFGGSVATQFAGMTAPSELEAVLNRCYSSGKTITYTVANMADGAWKQPHEVIALSLFKEFVDVAVSIEGFNEHYGYDGTLDFAVPANNFETVNPALQRHRFLKQAFSALYVSPENPLAHSSTYKLVTLFSRRLLESIVADDAKRKKWQKKWRWDLPDGIDSKARFVQRYSGFVRDFEAIAAANALKSVVVLQPAPIFKKQWTTEETAVITDKGYEQSYAAIKALLAKNSVNFLDLSALFADDTKTIFGDSIHFARGDVGPVEGDVRMADAIARYMSDRQIIVAKNECQ